MGIWRLIPREGKHTIDAVHAFYLNGLIRSLVTSLIGIFTPIFIYKTGITIFAAPAKAIILVAVYYFVLRAVTLITVIPISRLISHIGFRKSILISLFLLGGNLAVFVYATQNVSSILLAALLWGLCVPFYWVARNSALSQDAKKERIGTTMGWMTTFEQVATMLGPLVAGLIVETWGFQTLFVLALLILLTSAIPLWNMSPHTHHNTASWRGFRYFITNKRFTHIAVGVGARAIDDYAISTIWPLVIFVMGIKTAVLGGIFSLVAIVSLAVRMLVGKLFDKLRARMDWTDEIVFAISAFLSSVIWMMRLFVRTIYGILWVDVSGSLTGTVYSTMYIDYEQLGGKRMADIAYWVYDEVIYSIAVMWFMALVAIGAWFNVWREITFLTAAFWVVVSIVIARESNLRN